MSARAAVPSTKLEHNTGVKPEANTNQYGFGTAGAARLAQDVLLPHTGAALMNPVGLNTGNVVGSTVPVAMDTSSTAYCQHGCNLGHAHNFRSTGAALPAGSLMASHPQLCQQGCALGHEHYYTYCQQNCSNKHSHFFNPTLATNTMSTTTTATAFNTTPIVRSEGATVIQEKTEYVREGATTVREAPIYVQEAATVIEKPIIHEKKIIHEREVIHQQPIIHQKETIIREQPILVEKPVLVEKHVVVEQPRLAETHKTVVDQQRVVQENVVKMTDAPVRIQEPLTKVTDTTMINTTRVFCNNNCAAGCNLHCQQSCQEGCTTHCGSNCQKDCNKHQSGLLRK